MNRRALFVCVVAALVAIAAGVWWLRDAPVGDRSSVRFRSGWMTTWSGTGQVMSALQNTDILAQYKSEAEFIPFLFGPEINEAARAGRVDVTNTGIVPTLNLLAADDDWVIVGRLVHFNVSTIVKANSSIKRIADLRGLTVGVPFGGGSHPYIIQRLEESGIPIGDGPSSVQLINIKPPEQRAALEAGTVGAIATWEPQTSLALTNGFGRVIDTDVHVGFIAVRKSFIEQSPNELVALLRAYRAAFYYVATNRKQADLWFAKASQIDPELLARMVEEEPNLNVTALRQVDLTPSASDLELAQAVSDTMWKNRLLPKHVLVKDRVDLSFMAKASNEAK